MSKWFLIVIVLIFLACVMAILVRIDDRNEIKRVEKGDLSADDFEIIE